MGWTQEQLDEHYARLKQPPEGAQPAPCPDASEDDIQDECVKLMQEDGWRALRTDPVSDKSRGKGFGEIGMADYLFMRPMSGNCGHLGACEMLWVEFKARNGKPSKAQLDWHNKERARGFRTWIASVDFPASVEGFKTHYEMSGLMRRSKWL